MKILVCGKGGAGKSAISVLIAKKIAETGTVYVLDADESNRLLSRTFGVDAPDTLGNYFGGRKQLRQQITEHEKIKLGELPDDYIKLTEEGIRFASVGKIEEFGEGCACPYGFLSKELLKRIVLDEGEHLIVDTEAGVEHLGRGVEEGIDALVVVVDPTAEGVAIAALLDKEAKRIGKPLYIVINKMTDELEPILRDMLGKEGLTPSATIRYDPSIFRSSLEGRPIEAGGAMEDLKALTDLLFP
jgi:CO dehydrogenase maturation factor